MSSPSLLGLALSLSSSFAATIPFSNMSSPAPFSTPLAASYQFNWSPGDLGHIHVPMAVGDDQKLYTMIFDTASPDFWIPGTADMFDASKKMTAVNFNASDSSDDFVTAQGSTIFAETAVKFDPNGNGNIATHRQSVEVATSPPASCDGEKVCLGVFGAAPAMLGQIYSPTVDPVVYIPQQTFFNNTRQELGIDLLLGVSIISEGGTIQFNEKSVVMTDDQHYVGVDVTQGYWSLNADFTDSGNTNRAITVNTSTPFLWLAHESVTAYYSQVPGASIVNGMWQYPCAILLPPFKFGLGVRDQPDQYVPYTIPSEGMAYHQESDQPTGTCTSIMQEQLSTSEPQILGNRAMYGSTWWFDEGYTTFNATSRAILHYPGIYITQGGNVIS